MKLLFIILTVPFFAALGGTGTDSAKTYYLPPTVVTATKLDIAEKDVVPTVSVITSQELRGSNDASVFSILSERVPGFYLQERGILGYGISTASGEISIRGVGGDPNTEVLVLLDGRPQFMGLMGHPLPDAYRTSDAEKVEVIRGPASVLYGTNAMGGVINIISRKSTEIGLSASGDASYGSYGTQAYNLSLGESSAGDQVRFSAGHDQTNDYRANAGFNRNNAAANGTLALGENFSLNADASVTNFTAYDPGPLSAPLANNWYDVLRGEAGFSLDSKDRAGDGSLRFLYNWGNHKIFDGFTSTDNNFSVLLYHSFTLAPQNVITGGIDVKQYGGEAKSPPADFGSHLEAEKALYVLDQQFISNWLVLNAGGRLEHSSVFGDEFVPQAGLAYQANSTTTIKGSVAKGFRSPTIRELYLFPAPTPSLKPEQLWNYEVGVLHTFDERLNTELTAYIADGSNRIETGGIYPNLTLSNSGSFVHRGVECSLNYRLLESVSIHSGYGYLSTVTDTKANPRHNLTGGLDYSQGIVSGSINVHYVAKLYGDDYSQLQLPSYTLVKLSGTIRPSSMVSVTLWIENALNQSYQTTYDYLMPGRTIMGKVAVNY